MPGYQLYFLDAKGHVFRRQDMECVDDREAIAVANALKHLHGMELWRGPKTLKKFDAPDDAPRF